MSEIPTTWAEMTQVDGMTAEERIDSLVAQCKSAERQRDALTVDLHYAERRVEELTRQNADLRAEVIAAKGGRGK